MTTPADALRVVMACEWHYSLDDDSWDTGCGNKHQFTVDGPEENSHRFCPYCGVKLIAIAATEAAHD